MSISGYVGYPKMLRTPIRYRTADPRSGGKRIRGAASGPVAGSALAPGQAGHAGHRNVGGSCYAWVVSEETVFPPFRVSEAAVDQIVAVGGSMRVDITPGGCCGRTYVFTADAPDAGDEVFGCPGRGLGTQPGRGGRHDRGEAGLWCRPEAAAVPRSGESEYAAALPVPPFLWRGMARPRTAGLPGICADAVGLTRAFFRGRQLAISAARPAARCRR